ncbi:hypothetical protein BCR35DRAFT_303158 [Leucosporidium creatinivorum]|uniref:DUF1772-domain-containing protein n=1 Tax=Leucosporidium creatinivorum TaxID=106004 RepID=A0A1Y2FJF2_9BASI|nr:hypothetical protein BCR35DRAFT_303158 [Leucosporidium creatinivorum]
MSSTDAPALVFARGISAVGLGLLAGFQVTISTSSIHTIYQVPTLAPRDRLHLWSRIYDNGASLVIPAIPTLTLILSTAAYFAKAPALWAPGNWIGRHRSAVLATAAVLVFGNGVWTGLVMLPDIKVMKKMEENIIKDGAEASGKVDTDTFIQRWLTRHHFRTLITTSAFILSVAELACA